MAQYIIHSCNPRLWYVNQYLVPSMLAQNIPKENILVWNDTKEKGNLYSFLDSMEYCKDLDIEGCWHLQDDVIVCRKFKQYSEELDKGIVAGFASSYDSDNALGIVENVPYGEVEMKDIWYSFPCIRIPTIIAKEFMDWWYKIAVNDGEISRHCLNEKKNDDYAFRLYIQSYHKDMKVINAKPNLVNHIDYLLGGTLINQGRKGKDVTSLFFEDKDLVEQLERKLNESSKETYCG